MARVDRQLTPQVKAFPLKGLTTTLRENSGIPRAVVNVEVPLQSVVGPGTGNNLYIFGEADLPTGFAYAYLGTTVSCGQSQVTPQNNTWNWPYCRVVGDNPEAPNLMLRVADSEIVTSAAGHFNVETLLENTRVFSDIGTNVSQQIIWALPAQNVVTSFHSYNATNDTGTCRFSFAQRFLQYDIDQAYNYIVNNAIPTR